MRLLSLLARDTAPPTHAIKELTVTGCAAIGCAVTGRAVTEDAVSGRVVTAQPMTGEQVTPRGRTHCAPLRSRTWPLALMLILGTTAGTARTSADEVAFDTAATIACQDVTTEEFLAAHPGDRLLEAEIEISTLQRDAQRDDLELLIQIYSPRRAWQVVEYTPQNVTNPAYTGGITVEKTREHSAGVGLDGGGSFQKMAQVTGHASAGSKQVETERFEKPAPQERVLSSGLMNRGAGVYYKILATPQQFLEGGRRFTLRFRAPQTWRGDILQVACLARREKQRLKHPLSSSGNLGQAHFVVAAYVAGDEAAKQAAETYAQAEFQLRRLARQEQVAVRKRAYPHALDRIGRSLGVSEPKIPADWLRQLIFTSSADALAFERHLPETIQLATEQYRLARLKLMGLNGAKLAQR